MKDKENNETPTGDRGYEALFKSDNFNSPQKRKKWLGKQTKNLNGSENIA